MKILKTASAGSLISLVAAAGLWYCQPVWLIVLNELTFEMYCRGSLNNYTGRMGCAVILALCFTAGVVVAIGGLSRANRSRGLSRAGRVMLLLGAAATVAAGLQVLHTLWPLIVEMGTIRMGGQVPDIEDLARQGAATIGAFRLAFLLLLGTPIALLGASILGMNRPSRNTSRPWLGGLACALILSAGLALTATCALNLAYAHKFYAIIAADPELHASDAGSIGLHTIDLQFAAGKCLLFIGVVIGFAACSFVGPQAINPQDCDNVRSVCATHISREVV